MASDDDESQALQTAIRDSMQTAAQFGSLASGESIEVKQDPVQRVSIDDRIKEISLQDALELPLVNDPFGDTYVYIDAPPRQPEQDDIDYSRYCKHFETPMLVKKETLLRYNASNTNEGFNFEALFGSSAQFRTIRRKKLTTKLRENPKIKYVIDLTPPVEGDDAVFLTTELCCSQGVRLWYQAGHIWNVSYILVGGKEEYTSAQRQKLSPRFEANERLQMSTPSEYSPVRHRSAIERVIAALIGIDPKLDSAPKVWTTFAVAKYFGLKNSPVTDYIIRWLRAYPNSFFLEVCPEVSLRIADGLESHDLARDTFAILVGEEALDSLFRARMSNGDNAYSTYGRRREALPEKIFSRIEYASKSLQERISGDFENLVGGEMKWIENLPQVQRLLSINQPQLRDTVSALTQLLKDYVRGTIYKLLCVNYDYVPPPDFHHKGGDELIQRWDRAKIWSSLSIGERILSRTFWLALVSFTLFEGNTNIDIKKGWGVNFDMLKSSWEKEDELGRGACWEVRNQDVNLLVWEGQRLFAEQTHQPTFTLPDRTRFQTEAKPMRSKKLPFRPIQPKDELFGTEIDPHEEATWQLEATEPIDVPRTTPKIKSVSFQSDPEVIRSHLAASEDTAKDFLSGGLLNDAAVVVKEEHDMPPESNWTVATDQDVLRKLAEEAPEDSFWAGCKPLDEKEQDKTSTPPRQSLLPRPASESKRPWNSIPARTSFFDLQEFFLQAKLFIEAYARRKLQFADHLVREEPHEIGITNTLVCLEDSEWKYLPLWAGGYDDDTGGVFNDQVPTADVGFSTCGPGVHTGFTPANSDVANSEFEMVDNEYDAETINTSMANNRSFARPVNRRHVYAADSMESSSGDDFDMVSADEDLDEKEENARKLTEAQERLEMAQEEAARKAYTTQYPTGQLTDENYADLFNDYDDDDETDRADDDDDDDSFMHEDNEDSDTVMV